MLLWASLIWTLFSSGSDQPDSPIYCTFSGILDGYKKSVSLDLNGTFSSSDKEYDGEILMNVETLSKKKPEQTEDIEKVRINIHF